MNGITGTGRKKQISHLKTEYCFINDNWDELSAGFGGTSKFAEVSKIHLMIDLGMNDKAKEMLNVMAMRGLYDHVDGGFFRYSTDVDWEIPHFEKMLYNQAELIQLYSRAYKLYKYKLNFIAKVEDIQTKITIISKLQNVVIDSAIRVDSNIIKILDGNTAVDIL